MREINKIVIHCSATPPSMNIGAGTIRRWHVEERGWSDIGYHFVICRNGSVQLGRPKEKMGAHVAGHNSDSIGICWVGGVSQKNINLEEDNRTEAQEASLFALIRSLLNDYPDAEVLGHRDFKDVKKFCPSFDVKKWFESYCLPGT